jgi:hypothetical protein
MGRTPRPAINNLFMMIKLIIILLFDMPVFFGISYINDSPQSLKGFSDPDITAVAFDPISQVVVLTQLDILATVRCSSFVFCS